MERIQRDDADWHVTLRGSRRLVLFRDESDFSTFHGMLGESTAFAGMRLTAHCLMSNHFHLNLGGGSAALTSCMRKLDRAYSGYHNKRYGLSGHAFEAAYYCEPSPSDFILMRVLRYIHLNPVRSGQVASPGAYPWSNYQRFLQAPVDLLTEGERRGLSLFNSDPVRARVAYSEFVDADLRRKRLASTGKTPAFEIWQDQFRWILEHAAERLDVLVPLEPEQVAIHLGSRIGIPPRAMGLVLGYPDGRQVSQINYKLSRLLSKSPSMRRGIDALGVL